MSSDVTGTQQQQQHTHTHTHGREAQRQEVKAIVYADDGALMGKDPEEVQRYLDLYTETFARIGLKMNAEKMKALIMDDTE
jgi:Reverse transcriptase (RNA-dependent DNA polymerase)